MALVTVKIEDWKLLDMLLDRCDAWDISRNNKDLFEIMYQSYIDGDVFDGMELNIMKIVDNDAVNYCSVLYKEDTNKDDWEKLLKLYKDDVRDISCEHFESCSPSFIEAVSEDEERILVRY